MICSIEETDTGYRIDFPDGTHEVIEGTEEAEIKIGTAMITTLGKAMPTKLTLPAPSQGESEEGAPQDPDAVPKIDLKGAKTLRDLEDRMGDWAHENAVAIGRKGVKKLQGICKDKNFRGRRRFAS